MEYHFVVVYDSKTDTFAMDYEQQEDRYYNGPIYDPEAGEWIELTETIWGDESSDYNKSADAIYTAIRDLKLRERETNA